MCRRRLRAHAVPIVFSFSPAVSLCGALQAFFRSWCRAARVSMNAARNEVQGVAAGALWLACAGVGGLATQAACPPHELCQPAWAYAPA